MNMTKEEALKKVEELKNYIEQLDKKDWRDAFVEKGIIKEEMKTDCFQADCIKINNCCFCDKYQLICGYVAKFKSGGFWLNSEGLLFTTKGIGSDEKATYEDAKRYISRRGY